MGQIRIVIDLPGDSLLKALHRQPYKGYESVKLKGLLEKRLRGEFPEVTEIKVEIIANNIFFGIDVMGEDPGEVADIQRRVSLAVKGVVKELES